MLRWHSTGGKHDAGQVAPDLRHVCVQGSARQLELAAAEMAQAAAHLVELERSIVSTTWSGSSASSTATTEQARQEAAAVLERKMAAMEAVLAARRMPVTPVATPPMPEPEAAVDQVMQQMQTQMPTNVSTGPAAGDGHELILQVCTTRALVRDD
jgi:alpha-amylase